MAVLAGEDVVDVEGAPEVAAAVIAVSAVVAVRFSACEGLEGEAGGTDGLTGLEVRFEGSLANGDMGEVELAVIFQLGLQPPGA